MYIYTCTIMSLAIHTLSKQESIWYVIKLGQSPLIRARFWLTNQIISGAPINYYLQGGLQSIITCKGGSNQLLPAGGAPINYYLQGGLNQLLSVARKEHALELQSASMIIESIIISVTSTY